MITTIESLFALAVGRVDTVAPDAIEIVLDASAPRATALNAGVPSSFPRINGYVLIPTEGGSLVGLIMRLWTDRSNNPNSRDKDLVDLPFPLRKLTVLPVGTLVSASDGEDLVSYRTGFTRGVTVFPSVGDTVLLPTTEQLRAIIESDSVARRVHIGASPLLASSSVALDPDRLFGGHVAILGNTGSGKSCSVAGLVRWSLEAARDAIPDESTRTPNARFIILDPNGEYRTCFSDCAGGVRVFQLDVPDPGAKSLTVPGWIWNTNEWCAFSSAAPSVQRPILQQTLRLLRSGSDIEKEADQQVRRRLHYFLATLNERIASGGAQYSEWGPAQNFADLLAKIAEDGGRYILQTEKEVKGLLFTLVNNAKDMRDSHRYSTTKGTAYNAFSETDLLKIRDSVENVLAALPESAMTDIIPDDAPVPFYVRTLPDYLEQVAASSAGQAATMTSTLSLRIRNMLSDSRLSGVIAPEKEIPFASWLEEYIGASEAMNGTIAVIDLSLVPTDVVHIVVAVIGRVVFEALQRYLRMGDAQLPTVLVLEEAHSFVSRYFDEEHGASNSAAMCRATFERIAREGRKFGLGLVVSSQRPSELSPTVLSQCNTFLLHRLVNDRDQDLVGRLVPDTLGSMLRELPTLPARHAILVGQATPLPLLVEIRELGATAQPRSANPRFWDTWTRAKYRPVDWIHLAKDWTTH